MAPARIRPSTGRVVALAVAISLAAGTLLRAGQPAGDYTTSYAAIAYSQSTGRWGYSTGFSAEVNARRQSLANCVARDCKVVLGADNGYAALALGADTSAYGFGHSKTDQGAAVARRYALEACNERTSRCRPVVSVHSWAG